MYLDTISPTCLPIFTVFWFLYDTYSNWRKVKSHCGFYLHYLMTIDPKHFFLIPGCLYIIPWEMPFHSHCHCLIGLFIEFQLFRSRILIFYQLAQSANIFSHSADCLLIVLHVSFDVQKLFSLTQFCLFLLYLPVTLESFPLSFCLCQCLTEFVSWHLPLILCYQVID